MPEREKRHWQKTHALTEEGKKISNTGKDITYDQQEILCKKNFSSIL